MTYVLKNYNISYYDEFVKFVLDSEKKFYESGKMIVRTEKFGAPDVYFYFNIQVELKGFLLNIYYKVYYYDDLASINTLENGIYFRFIDWKISFKRNCLISSKDAEYILSKELKEKIKDIIQSKTTTLLDIFKDFLKTEKVEILDHIKF